jgi:hypothetical protein
VPLSAFDLETKPQGGPAALLLGFPLAAGLHTGSALWPLFYSMAQGVPGSHRTRQEGPIQR